MSNDIRTVTVTDCTPKKRKDGSIIEGVSQFGNPWRLHSILAVDDAGLPIQDELVSFDPLPVGEPVELQFQFKPPPADHPEWRGSYTLSFPKGSRAARPQVTDDGHEMLREQLRLLLDRVVALEEAVKRLGGFTSTLSETDVPVVETPVPVSEDDSVPF